MYKFSKYHGLGNDFLIFDERSNAPISNINFPSKNLIKRLCNRNFGVGADGIIVARNPTYDSYTRMSIYNNDGSEAEMCGNGIRCLVKYLLDKGDINLKQEIGIETLAGEILAAPISEDKVKVNMGNPILDPFKIPTRFEITFELV